MKKILPVLYMFLVFAACPAFSQYQAIDSILAQVESSLSRDSLDFNKLSVLQRAFNESKEGTSDYRMDEICSAIGDFFFEYGLYENAVAYYSHIFTTNIDTTHKSRALINIYRKLGQSFSALGQPDKAYYYYGQIFDEFSFPERLDVLRDIVEIYADNGDHLKSLEYNFLIEKLLLDYDASKSNFSKTYNNIGYNYHHLKQYENGIRNFNKALEIYSGLSPDEESAILGNLGISYYNLGNYKKSLELLQNALKKAGEKYQQAELLHLMATVHLANNDHIRAVSYFEKAEQLASETGRHRLLSDIYAGYAIVFNATHEYELAFDYFKRHSRLRDSLKFVEELNQRRILDNQKYIERAEKENRLLKAQQDYQKLQIAQLETEARNQMLRNEALISDSIQAANELALARQQNEIAAVTESNNLLEIARQENLLRLRNQQLEIALANEENAKIESEKRQQEIELAQQTISLQERESQLNVEKASNEQKAMEIEKRKREQRNTIAFASLVAGLTVVTFWGYRNKRRDNKRLTYAYDNLAKAQNLLKDAEAKIRSLLKQQVSGAVAEALLTNDNPAAEEQKFVSVMFLDIRDFTKFCESLAPSEIISYQNSIFGFMLDIIEKHHGVVNQLLGDGLMATFGAPVSNGNDSLNAYKAAHEIIGTLAEKVSRKEIHPTKIGIGLHSGHVVTGNVGTEERKQFSITGNTVILAARLEQLNKQFGSTLVYSKDLYNELPAAERKPVNFQPVVVKGRSTPVEVATV